MYLSFALDQEEYGIEIQFIEEVMGLQQISKLPDMPQAKKMKV